jgi:hypothetical protein
MTAHQRRVQNTAASLGRRRAGALHPIRRQSWAT